MTRALEIRDGQTVDMTGETWTVRGRIGSTKVILQRADAPPRVMSVEEIAGLMAGGDLSKAEPVRPVIRDLADISEREWEVARARHQIVLGLQGIVGRTRTDVEAAGRLAGVNASTVYDWVTAYEARGYVTDLIPAKPGPKKGSTRLSSAIEKIIREKIDEIFLNKTPVQITRVQKGIEEACRKAGLKPPAGNTIRARIGSLDPEKVLIRQGRRDKARDKFRPVRAEFPDEGVALAVVQIDHTLGNVVLVDEEHRLPLDRPWITFAIDVCTRIVCGFYISLEAPSAAAVGMCLVHAILPKAAYLAELDIPGDWPVLGKPGRILVDNAKEFRGEVLNGACLEHSIGLTLRPVKTPHYGGHIERLMKTSSDEINTLPGTTFSNPQKRGQHDSEATAAMTPREFEAYVADWVVNKYNRAIHRQIDAAPLYAFRRSTVGTAEAPGIGLRPVAAEEKLRLDFMPFERRAVDRHGVVIDYIHYWDEVLKSKVVENFEIVDGSPRARSAGVKHVFRFDPRDMSVIQFWDPDTRAYYPIPYRNTARPAVSRFEIRQAKAKRREEGLEHFDEDAMFDTIARLRARATASVEKTKQARKEVTRRRQAEALAAKRATAAPPASQPTTPPSPEQPLARAWPSAGDPFATPVERLGTAGDLMPRGPTEDEA